MCCECPDSVDEQGWIRPPAVTSYVKWLLKTEKQRADQLGLKASRPQWLMLVDLWLAHVERRNVSISSLCIASEVPPTTALRHIGVLLKTGYVTEEDDASDRRRRFARLTPFGLARVESQLAAETANWEACVRR